jgi:Rrf2 family protein
VFVINSTDRYRLLLLIELASARGSCLQIAEISRRRDLPAAYLAQLVAELSRRGVVVARRGPNGGVRLAVDPCDISINDLLSGAAVTDPASPAVMQLQDRLSMAWEEATAQLTLDDLLQWERSAAQQPEYVI